MVPSKGKGGVRVLPVPPTNRRPNSISGHATIRRLLEINSNYERGNLISTTRGNNKRKNVGQNKTLVITRYVFSPLHAYRI